MSTVENTETDPVYRAVAVLAEHRHEIPPDALRSLADIWTCASAARYGRPHETFWDDIEETCRNHDTRACELGIDGTVENCHCGSYSDECHQPATWLALCDDSPDTTIAEGTWPTPPELKVHIAGFCDEHIDPADALERELVEWATEEHTELGGVSPEWRALVAAWPNPVRIVDLATKQPNERKPDVHH